MAKSDRTIAEIDLHNAYSNQFSPTWVDGKLINAFDTETSDGSVFMLTYAHGNEVSAYHNSDVTELDDSTIINALTHHLTRSNLNVWYNLDFDVNAIMSGILSNREMTELVVTNETTTEIENMEYEITYVKEKFLQITDSHDNISRHYDIAQFFYTSLDNAAEEWLDENKAEGIDTSKFDNEEYIKENYDDILHYAKKDAKLTQDLGLTLTSEAEKLDIPMGSPISTGYLSAEYLRGNRESKPGLGNEQMQGMFWESYYGGRFEVFKRGNVGEIAAPDINSAYPAVMRNLPDPKTLNWQHYDNTEQELPFSFTSNNFSFKEIEEGDYGVVRANVSTDPNRKIQPFACKIDGKVKYPVMTNKEVTVIKPIFEFAVNEGLVTDFELLEAWIGDKTENSYRPFKFINDMYAQRKVYEILEGKMKKGELLKIVLNSSYGKTCQTTDKQRMYNLSNKGDYTTKYNETQYNKMYLSKKQRRLLDDDEIIITESVSGKRFNPFLAAYITGMTRLELHWQVVNHGLEDATVMFATDCLMVERDAYENSTFNEQIIVPDENLPEPEFREKAIESLGAWDYDYRGSGFIVGSGVYEVEKDSGGVKTKTRGFLEKNLEGTLKDMARKNPKGIPLDNERPLTMAEVLISSKDGNVSQFVEKSKKLQPGFDDKRIWERDSPTFTELLNSSEESKPINLQSIADDKIEQARSTLEIDQLPTEDLISKGAIEGKV